MSKSHSILIAAIMTIAILTGCNSVSDSNDTINNTVTSKDQVIGLWMLAGEKESGISTKDSAGIRTVDTYAYDSPYDPVFDEYMGAYYIAFTADSMFQITKHHIFSPSTSIVDTVRYSYSISGGKLYTVSAGEGSYVFDISMIDGQLVTYSRYISHDTSGNVISKDSALYTTRVAPCAGLPISAWTAGLSADSYEPDNAPSTAKALNVGTTSPKHSLTLNDTDTYAITGLAPGKTYDVVVYSVSHVRADLIDVDKLAGPALKYYWPDTGNGYDFHQTFTATASPVYLRLVNESGSQTNYTARVLELP